MSQELDAQRYQRLRSGKYGFVVGVRICSCEVEAELEGDDLDNAVDAADIVDEELE